MSNVMLMVTAELALRVPESGPSVRTGDLLIEVPKAGSAVKFGTTTAPDPVPTAAVVDDVVVDDVDDVVDEDLMTFLTAVWRSSSG